MEEKKYIDDYERRAFGNSVASGSQTDLAEKGQAGRSGQTQPPEQDNHGLSKSKQNPPTRSGIFLAAALCGMSLLVLSSPRFLRHRSNLPLALADAQAFIARNAVKGTCEDPKFDSLGSAASGSLVWRAASFVAVFPTFVSILLFCVSIGAKSEDVRNTVWVLNGV